MKKKAIFVIIIMLVTILLFIIFRHQIAAFHRMLFDPIGPGGLPPHEIL